jgi:OOP family OmpA-OmpF porin
MQESDRAVETARQAGKAQEFPDDFKTVEDAKDHAYDVFRSCHTEEGAALAKQATAMANALMAKKVALAPPPPPPTPVPAPALPPPPPAPSNKLTVSPNSVNKGETATLVWTSQNATNCDIQPGIGPVQAEGTMTITPADNTSYTLTCRGEGGSAKSAANIAVVIPPPPVTEVVQPKATAKMCQPAIINVQFDTNKADIKPEFHDELKKLGDFLVEFPNAKGTVDGHTDNVGSKASNLKLSQLRADSICNYIIKNFGIAPERIKAKGYGLTKPVADNKTKEGKAMNRRIEANFVCE